MTYDSIGFNHPNPVFNRFLNAGKTLQWWGADTERNYQPDGNLYSREDIEYKLNEKGFRCDEFDRNSDVVFLGCSITEGIGVRQEETWAYRLLEHIRKDSNKKLDYVNLAMGGAGLDAIVRTFNQFRQTLQPKIVFALLPGYRRELYNLNNDSWNLLFHLPNDERLTRHNVLIDERTVIYETQKNMIFLSLMVKDVGAKLVWANWAEPNLEHNIQTKSSAIFLLDRKGRDKVHPGPIRHSQFADYIYEEQKKLILESLL